MQLYHNKFFYYASTLIYKTKIKMNRIVHKQLHQQFFTRINETQMSQITVSKFLQQLEEKPQEF